jgi:hypothetical protein
LRTEAGALEEQNLKYSLLSMQVSYTFLIDGQKTVRHKILR